MKSRIALVAVLSSFVSFMSASAYLHGQQPQAQQHEEHHPGAPDQPATAAGDQHAAMMQMMAKMHANDQKLDDLVKTMNAAKGAAKVDAIAELLTTLVQDQKTMHESMMPMMMNMMGSMGTMHGAGDSNTPPRR